jgi:hypothetical protein
MLSTSIHERDIELAIEQQRAFNLSGYEFWRRASIDQQFRGRFPRLMFGRLLQFRENVSKRIVTGS